MLGLEIESFVGSVTAPTRRGFRRFVALAAFAAKEVVSATPISAGPLDWCQNVETTFTLFRHLRNLTHFPLEAPLFSCNCCFSLLSYLFFNTREMRTKCTSFGGACLCRSVLRLRILDCTFTRRRKKWGSLRYLVSMAEPQ